MLNSTPPPAAASSPAPVTPWARLRRRLLHVDVRTTYHEAAVGDVVFLSETFPGDKAGRGGLCYPGVVVTVDAAGRIHQARIRYAGQWKTIAARGWHRLLASRTRYDVEAMTAALNARSWGRFNSPKTACEFAERFKTAPATPLPPGRPASDSARTLAADLLATDRHRPVRSLMHIGLNDGGKEMCHRHA